jgi:hypothetical protein
MLAVHHLTARFDGMHMHRVRSSNLISFLLLQSALTYLFPLYALISCCVICTYFGRIFERFHKDNSVRVMNCLMPE